MRRQLLIFLCLGPLATALLWPAGGDELRRVASDPLGGGDATISPDGRSFATTSRRSGNWDVWIYDLDSAEWRQVTSDPADDFEAQWSPDGTRLAFTSTRKGSKDIWTISLADGELKQITFTPEDEEYPSWSPDGKSLVFTGGPWKARDFFLVPAEGGEPRKVTRKSGEAGACSFMPKGQFLVCHGYDSGSGDVFILSVSEGTIRQVTTDEAWDYKPSVSADGEWVAFSRSDDGPSAVWLKSLRNGSLRPLVTTPHNDRWPTWAASGQRLLFHRMVEEGIAVKILDRQTGTVETVVAEDQKPLQAAFEPSGSRIVYCAETARGKRLRVTGLKTRSVRELDTGPGEACHPRWSPDGKSIAYVSKSADRWEVATISADGGPPTHWTTSRRELRRMFGPVDWSPDSTRIVFQAHIRPYETDLFMIDTRSGEIRNLTDDGWFNESASWAPTGDRIAFMSTRGGDWTWGLFLLSIDTGEVEIIDPPDYTQKNFPRVDGENSAVWSVYRNGIEYLAQKVGNQVSIVKEAGAWARWPSFSPDRRYVVFTTIDHRVEYWIADNIGSSEALSGDLGTKTKDTQSNLRSSEGQSGPRNPILGLTRSPVDLHHR